MIFDGRRPSVEDILLYGYSILPEKKCLRLITLTVTAQLTPNRKFYQLSKPEIELQMMEEMYATLHM